MRSARTPARLAGACVDDDGLEHAGFFDTYLENHTWYWRRSLSSKAGATDDKRYSGCQR
jgi:hypothetical protein